MVLIRASFALSLSLVFACSAPEPPPPSGGSDAGAGECGRGLVVFDSDYHSTNVSLVDFEGKVLSPSFISSASAPTGLSAPLSGDVVAPTMGATGDIVLVDRYPAAVLTFVDPTTAKVRAQLDVKTGFASNPHDYAAITAAKGYVLRYETNHASGHEAFDGGGDVLVVDPSAPEITGRIDLASTIAGEKSGLYPRPERIVVVGPRAFVLVGASSPDFQRAAPSRIVTLDTARDAIAEVTVLEGLYGCAGLALSPSGDALAVACSGTFEGSSTADVDQAGVAIVDVVGPLKVTTKIAAKDLGGDPLGFSLAFVAERAILATSFGREGGADPKGDRALLVDLDGGSYRDVLRTAGAFTFGDVRCAAGCGACFLADADQPASLVRFDLDVGELTKRTSTAPDPKVGLPARYIGAF